MFHTRVSKKIAVVILSYSDYESLELTLAAHSMLFNLDDNIKFYILQNGRGSYDCERTLKVALRYRDLFPRKIVVVTDIKPQAPYFAIRELLHKECFKDIEYVIKLDDDVFPLTQNWIDSLYTCYDLSLQKYGDSLAYVTSLVNNNPYGFKKIIEIMGLRDEFFTKLAREHFVGLSPEDTYSPYRILPKETISTGGGGTIWRYSYIARWLHQKTTMNVEDYVKATSKLGFEELNSKERYSINCLFFRKSLWDEIRNESDEIDDELLWQKYCIHNKKRTIVNLSVPMVHLFFQTQREENRDLIEDIRKYFESIWNLPFPVAINDNRLIEIENRLRFMEKSRPISNSTSHLISFFSLGYLRDFCKKKLNPHSKMYLIFRNIYHKLLR